VLPQHLVLLRRPRPLPHRRPVTAAATARMHRRPPLPQATMPIAALAGIPLLSVGARAGGGELKWQQGAPTNAPRPAM
jgi:hypothetical protein